MTFSDLSDSVWSRLIMTVFERQAERDALWYAMVLSGELVIEDTPEGELWELRVL